MMFNAIGDNLSRDLFSRICSVAADGPYQATNFRAKLLEMLGIGEDDAHLALPITWDAAHALNLGVTDVKESKEASGIHFQRFIKRCNIFNSLLANGKGFAFLQMIDQSAIRPVSYAAQRFVSSSYEQWLKIEKGYKSFWQAFELLHPNRDEDEQWQYMIGGADFIADLLAFLDLMEPIVDLMLHVQSLDAPVWKLKLWWPKVRNKLSKAASGDPTAFPRLEKVGGDLVAGDVFSDVELLPGWLVMQDKGEVGDNRFTWEERTEDDVKCDREKLASDLINSLENRVNTVMADEVYSILEVFDAAILVNLQCGYVENDVIKFVTEEGRYESFGVEQC